MNIALSKLKEIRSLSHALKTDVQRALLPLRRTVDGYSGVLDQELKEDIEMASFNLNEIKIKIHKIIEISDYSRKITLNKSKISIAQIIKESLNNYKLLADKHGVEIINLENNNLPEVIIDKERMTYAFDNLIGNSIEYNIEGGQILVKCFEENSNIVIVLADNGTGFYNKKEQF